MKVSSYLCLISCLVISLSACGNKGPLYLPDQTDDQKAKQVLDKSLQKRQLEKKQ